MEERRLYAEFVNNTAFKNNKMAFICGPRQVGKTTLTQLLLEERGRGKYYTWDDVEFKRQWIKDPKKFVPETIGPRSLVVFDELHKAPRWKPLLKGVYDLRHTSADILVTGSARLDVFRRGGDSLLGRYFLLRMHPFTLGELRGGAVQPGALHDFLNRPISPSPQVFSRLFQFGGFPDPYLKADPTILNLWHRTRLERLIREDLFDVARTHEISLIETCATLIPERVGSPFSFQSLSEDLSVSHPTVRRWLLWLSRLFYVYFVPPYSKKLARSLRKQPKVYLWDWSEIADEPARFENMVAGHFWKACHYWTDCGLGNFELFYIRDKEKREVDFLVTRDRKPWILSECKLSESSISPHLFYYAERLGCPIALQVIKTSGVQELFDLRKGEKGYLMSADAFLKFF